MARRKPPYRAKLINGMYSYKEPRIKSLTYQNSTLRSRVERRVDQVNKRLTRLDRGIDLNKATRNPRTGKYERKGTITIISDSGKRVKIRQRKIVSYKGSFASKKLSILDQYNESTNRITLRGNESYQELLSLDKATRNFLKSKSSTISGIKDIEKNIKQNISNKMDEFDLSKDEVETLYNFFEDPDFNYIRKYIDPSDLWVFIENAKQDNMDSEEWLKTIENYIGSDVFGRDEDLRDKLVNLYSKYMGFNALL